MRIRKNKLWRVPIYCGTVSIVAYNLFSYFLTRFSLKVQPDGSLASDPVRMLIVYGSIFLCAVLLGWPLFRKLSHKEIFLSASIAFIAQIFIIIIQLMLEPSKGFLAFVQVALTAISDWGNFISRLVFQIGGKDWMWLGIFAEALAPFIFTIFGQKNIRMDS